MPPRKSRDKEVQPAQADHADDSPLHSEGENDPITFLPVSPLAERSYGNPVFKEKEADRGGDFAESSNVFRGMMEHLDLAFKEKNQTMQRLVESQAESSRRQEEIIRQCMEDMRRVFEEGTRVMQETGEESRRTLQAVSKQVVEQVRQPRPEIPPPVNFFMGEGQRQHEPMEATAPVADHGHQPQHRHVPPGRKGNMGPHHQPYPRDFFQPQVPPAQPVQRGLQNHPAQLFNRDQLIDLCMSSLLFSGEVGQSTIEHIGRFTIQCGEASGDDNLKFRRFPSSLTGTALTWLAQKPGESSEAFLARFRRAKLKCRVALPEQEFVKLAQNVARYENLLKEDVQKKVASHGTYYSDPNFDLDVAEVVIDKPVVCPDLVRPTHQPETSVRRYVGEAGKPYTFDVSKASDIFDHLKKSGLIKLPPKHNIPTAAEIGTRDYCKFHNSWKHSTNNCLIFRNILQEKIDKGILKFPDKAKETMGVDADPFPAVSVGVNVADLRSVARNRSLPYAQRNLAAEDLRWVLEAQRSRHSKSVRSDQQRLGGQERITVTRNFSQEGARRYSIGTRSPRMVKLPLSARGMKSEKDTRSKWRLKQVEAEGSSSRRPRQPTKRNMVWVRKEKKEAVTQTLQKEDDQSSASPKVASIINEEEPIVCEFPEQTEEEVIVVPAQDDEKEDMADKIVFEKPKEKMARHIRPLYINAHMDGTPISRVLIHSSWCVPSSLHQKLIFWNGGKAEVVSADDKPFSANTHLVEARYYEEDIGTIQFFGMDRHGKPIGITACSRLSLSKHVVEEEREKAVLEITKKLAAYFAEKAVQVDRSEIVHEGEEADQGDEITLEELDLAPAKLDDLKAEVQDPLEEINLGSKSEPKVTFISGSLEPQTRDQIVRLLYEFKDCFAWDYSEMPGLDRKLVEHKLPIVEGFRPYKQPPRRMSAEVTLKVKEEIERLIKVGFIRTCRYADWLSNVVPVLKKNGKLRVCADFRNLNLATPKDEHPMPIADLLVDGVARHKILSFMDGHSGYNQIFIADADVPTIAFRCPGAVGTFEWVVMPFGLKNAGATYQRATNAIFHDMIGKFMEIYIDDVVVKSNGEADHLVHLRKSFEQMRQHGLKMNPFKCAFGVSAGNFLGYLVHERGLEVEKNKGRAVIEAKPPQNKKELQRFLGQVNFLRRFISNLAGKTRVFSPLLKLKSEADFKWEELHQSAFDMIKRRGNDELLLRCLGPDESFQMLSDVHDGICGAHQAGIKMRWFRRHGFFWPFVLKDCIAYAKGCKSCQIHWPLQRVPAFELNSIVKPWPFRGWAIDLIGKVYPPSSKDHSFIIVATDYFTKWVEAKPMKKVNQSDVIKFIKENIIHRFGLSETITTDQGTVFVSHQVEAFAKEMGLRLLNSTPHYAQANGQAEASNKVVINLLEKMVDDNPRRWHELLSKILWAYRTSQRSSTKMTPFALTYGHDVVLPMEITARSLRVMIQHNLQSGEYDEAMMLELEDLEDSRLTALDRLQAQKLKVAKSYNKRVKGKNLVVGDLVWKAILPLGKKDHRFGKWSPNWEGPF
ncbi:hypothetical protein SLEP1_g24610 [Rubroshorea leprosula]|uniref:Integrase catalytic domain-containing protein n=1 Tax=Rubroshorea leprosula TaxID=152421 RepID=A0AAV5JQG4_9ROSI|nr:hypothetical protein SLEP1_g24610 [Rubroshorea leprosula]